MNDAGSVGAGELSASFDALMRIIKSEPEKYDRDGDYYRREASRGPTL